MSFLEYLAALLVATGVAWLLANIGRYRSGPLEWLGGGFAQLVSGWRGDPWPRGVQEEDRDRPWGRTPPASRRRRPAPEPPPPTPVLTPIRAQVRHR